MSLSKRIQYRSLCIEQLDKWHDHKKRDVITDSQYAEMQNVIFSDIKKVLTHLLYNMKIWFKLHKL